VRTAPAALVAALCAAPAAGQTHILVVSGLTGEARFEATFHETATTILEAAHDRFAVPATHMTYLAATPATDPARIAGRSTKDEVLRVLEALAAGAEPDALIVIVLIGHGSASGGDDRLNLPGPDLSAEEFAAALGKFPTQRLVVVNAASASGGWIPALSGDRRTIITATRSATERHESYFGKYFAQAFASDGADTDKNDRISLLEVFEYARQEVQRYYEGERRMLTEHALLDDNGDGAGSLEPDPTTGDGAVARQIFLDQAARRGPVADSALAALQQRQDSLQTLVTALRGRKDTMPEAAYQRELERLLLDVARIGRQIRQRSEAGRR